MKINFSKSVLVLLTFTLYLLPSFAQSPEKMSYQAVIRNSNDQLIRNQVIGLKISILQYSELGIIVYEEAHTTSSNANGLLSVEIGSGTLISGDFRSIDWSKGPYFIQTETSLTDSSGSQNLIVTGISELLSVPYAFHAKTAETVTGGITEADPVYSASVASGITATDTINWNNKLDSEIDPVFTAWDKSTGISITESQISDLNHFTTADETDPIFGASVANSITGTDTTNWNNKLDSETDPSVPDGTTAGEMQYWDGSAWITVAPGTTGQVLTFVSGVPTWKASGGSNFTHYIGEQYGGGVIFHLWKDSIGVEHGLIVALTDQSTSQAWSNVTSTEIGASAQSTWDGLSNSNAIVGQAGHTSSAAKLCLDLVSGGQSDWYLPSKLEINMLWNNYYIVARALSQISGATQLTNNRYWSSSEGANYHAWGFYFSHGAMDGSSKLDADCVRAVRAF